MTQVPGTSAAVRPRTGSRAFPPAEAPTRTRTQWGGPWMRVLAVIASVVLLAITARFIGAQALTAGFTALGPVGVLAAVVLGFAATGAQRSTAPAGSGLAPDRRRRLSPLLAIVAIIGLAAMSLPVGAGGWGARELSVGLLAGPLALHAESAVSAATAYELLATVSALPGLAALLWHWLRGPGQQGWASALQQSRGVLLGGCAEDELRAHIGVEQVSPERHPQRLGHHR